MFPLHRLSFVSLLCLAACTGACTKTKSPMAASVGRFAITQRDAELKNRVAAIYYPNDGRNLGLQQLVREYTYAQILENNGHPITPDIVAREAERIEKETMAPEQLRQIQRVFEDDRDAYLRVFVLPVYVTRTINYGFFQKRPELHQEAFQRAKRDFDAVRSGARRPAGGSPLPRFSISADGLLTWELPEDTAPGKSAPAGSSAAPDHLRRHIEGQMTTHAPRPLLQIMRALPVGTWHKELIEWGDRWYGVKRVKGDAHTPKDALVFETVSYPKRSYAEWLEVEKKKVSVKTYP